MRPIIPINVDSLFVRDDGEPPTARRPVFDPDDHSPPTMRNPTKTAFLVAKMNTISEIRPAQ